MSPHADLTPPPAAPAPQPGSAAPSGPTIGTGPVRVALIAPLTQNGNPSVIGVSLRNAVDLAVSETGANDITVLVKDDMSTADGARAAAQAAVAEGADLIIGPLFASGVREAGRIARTAGKPVIAFSTDSSVASHGVYLLSFLVESYVDRIVDFASSRGKKSIAALVPENDYGNVALGELQTAAARAGMRVAAIERYKPGQAAQAVKNIAALGDQIDSLFIPEQAEAMPAIGRQLQAANIDTRRVQILGTGLWNDTRALGVPALQGAWFSAPENGGFNAFAARYRTKFNSDPTRLATLAYDATTLAIALSRAQGSARYSDAVLTNPAGFNGADGVFRFRPDGLNERGLSVLQIGNGSTTVVSPAPRSFSGAPS
ncbi:MAG: penicillin-binding protein activator [Hyphomicrobiales bacterium]|nr:penicillin-binding protein activator [Hyphomicrobiales bacterium]